MPEPWKHEPLTVTAEQRVAALRTIASARTHARSLDDSVKRAVRFHCGPHRLLRRDASSYRRSYVLYHLANDWLDSDGVSTRYDSYVLM